MNIKVTKRLLDRILLFDDTPESSFYNCFLEHENEDISPSDVVLIYFEAVVNKVEYSLPKGQNYSAANFCNDLTNSGDHKKWFAVIASDSEFYNKLCSIFTAHLSKGIPYLCDTFARLLNDIKEENPKIQAIFSAPLSAPMEIEKTENPLVKQSELNIVYKWGPPK